MPTLSSKEEHWNQRSYILRAPTTGISSFWKLEVVLGQVRAPISPVAAATKRVIKSKRFHKS